MSDCKPIPRGLPFEPVFIRAAAAFGVLLASALAWALSWLVVYPRTRHLTAGFLIMMPALAGACVWGSFDDERVNYDGGVLTTGYYYDELRSLIAEAGATLAPSTPALTAGYLAGVDIFYTSLLSGPAGPLSAAEQTALRNWVAGGGTLIVTADHYPLEAYESFTAYYGVTGYLGLANVGTAEVVGAHALTEGVSTLFFNTECTFTYGSDALLLAENFAGQSYCIVMEPATGFLDGGRLFVIGDHNGFTDYCIDAEDNGRMATHLVAWACAPYTGAGSVSWSDIKARY